VNCDSSPARRSLRLRVHLVVALLVLCLPGMVRGDALGDAARELAGRIAAALPPGEGVTLNLRNLSSLSAADVAAVRMALEAELVGRGFRLAPTTVAAAEAGVTLSEALQGYVWIAEIRRGGAVETIIATLPRPTAAPFRVVPALAIEKELIWEQENPIVDLALFADADSTMAVLEAHKLSLYERRGDLWGLRRIFSLPPGKSGSRDLRGKIFRQRSESGDALLIFLPGWRCGFSMTEMPAGPMLPCEPAAEATLQFPIVKGQEAVGATRLWPDRNYFAPEFRAAAFHADLPEPFFSAAVLSDEHGGDLFVFSGAKGRAFFYDHRGIPAGTTEIRGSELAGIKTNCRSGWQLLATGAGDWTEADSVQAYEIQAGAAAPVGPAVEFPGPIVSLSASSDGVAVAVATNLKTGRYEAYRLAIFCGR